MKTLEQTTYNTSIFVNSDTACENNCPGCIFGFEKADLNNCISLDELKKRVDYLSENINYGDSLIFQPGNILLNYEFNEVEELFEYSFKKTNKPIQWEIASLDEKILDFLDSKKIQKLIKEKKLFLNIGYLKRDLKLLKKVFNKIIKIGKEKREEELEAKGHLEKLKLMNPLEYLNTLNTLVEKGDINGLENSILFAIHNISDNNKQKGEEKKNDMIKFLEYCGFNTNLNEIEGNTIFYSVEGGISIRFVFLEKNKISQNQVIWLENYKKGDEGCLLNGKIELDIIGDGSIRAHTNPCNQISFGDINNTGEEIDKNFKEHKSRIFRILTKYKYSKNFDQAELCRKCLNGEDEEINNLDIFKYIIRKQIFEIKELFKLIIKKD